MAVLPMEGQTSPSVDGKEGVYDFAQKGGEVAELFGEFCRHSLCLESWDFIMDCMAYKILADPQEQFTCFIGIVDQYLRPTSPQEVNLGSKMSTFTSLYEVTRNTVIDAPVGEIVLMLEHNILAKFKLTLAMQQLEQSKLMEIELQSARVVADGNEGILALMASVSRGRMESPMNRTESQKRSSIARPTHRSTQHST